MPVEVVGRPSEGDGRTPGTLAGVTGGPLGAAGVEEGLASPTFRLRKDIACLEVYWYGGRICILGTEVPTNGCRLV